MALYHVEKPSLNKAEGRKKPNNKKIGIAAETAAAKWLSKHNKRNLQFSRTISSGAIKDSTATFGDVFCVTPNNPFRYIIEVKTFKDLHGASKEIVFNDKRVQDAINQVIKDTLAFNSKFKTFYNWVVFIQYSVREFYIIYECAGLRHINASWDKKDKSRILSVLHLTPTRT